MATIKTANTTDLIDNIVSTVMDQVGGGLDVESAVSYADRLVSTAASANFQNSEDKGTYDDGTAWTEKLSVSTTALSDTYTEKYSDSWETYNYSETVKLTGKNVNGMYAVFTGFSDSWNEKEVYDGPGDSGTWSSSGSVSATINNFAPASTPLLEVTAINQSGNESWSDQDGSGSYKYSSSFTGSAKWDTAQDALTQVVIKSLKYSESSKDSWDSTYDKGSDQYDASMSLSSKVGFTVGSDLSLSGQLDSFSYSEKGSGSDGWWRGSQYVENDYKYEDSFQSSTPIAGTTVTALQSALQNYYEESYDASVDTLRAELLAGDDTITVSDDKYGGFIEAGSGNDTVKGGKANDYVNGEAGNDKIAGGDGNDHLYGSNGTDRITGDAGNDHLSGGDDNDTLDGSAGNDSLSGDNGDDSLTGGAGNDSLSGGLGIDKLVGGEGYDYLLGDDGDDSLDGGAGNDRAYGGEGNDKLFGSAGHDVLEGGNGNDNLDGSAGNDEIDGGAGNDALLGGAGFDWLYGSAGNDTVDGGAGNDVLWGDAGQDTLIGGAGKDGFYFSVGDSGMTIETMDVIKDFSVKDDVILVDSEFEISDDAVFQVTGAQTSYDVLLAAANAKFADEGSASTEFVIGRTADKSAYVFADTDMNGTADMAIKLVGIASDTDVAKIHLDSGYYFD